jgi:hypothetical protein
MFEAHEIGAGRLGVSRLFPAIAALRGRSADLPILRLHEQLRQSKLHAMVAQLQEVGPKLGSFGFPALSAIGASRDVSVLGSLFANAPAMPGPAWRDAVRGTPDDSGARSPIWSPALASHWRGILPQTEAVGSALSPIALSPLLPRIASATAFASSKVPSSIVPALTGETGSTNASVIELIASCNEATQAFTLVSREATKAAASLSGLCSAISAALPILDTNSQHVLRQGIAARVGSTAHSIGVLNSIGLQINDSSVAGGILRGPISLASHPVLLAATRHPGPLHNESHVENLLSDLENVGKSLWDAAGNLGTGYFVYQIVTGAIKKFSGYDVSKAASRVGGNLFEWAKSIDYGELFKAIPRNLPRIGAAGEGAEAGSAAEGAAGLFGGATALELTGYGALLTIPAALAFGIEALNKRLGYAPSERFMRSPPPPASLLPPAPRGGWTYHDRAYFLHQAAASAGAHLSTIIPRRGQSMGLDFSAVAHSV